MSTIINDDYNACLFNLPVIYIRDWIPVHPEVYSRWLKKSVSDCFVNVF